MDELRQIHNRLLNNATHIFERDFYKEFTFDGDIVGIVGPRGVGKTTFLLYYIQKNYAFAEDALYVSCDNIYFIQNSLFNLAHDFYTYNKGKLLCIDEIHKYNNWNQELKNITDSFPDLKILFSGSSSIDILKGKFDLSRRVITKRLFGLSFREYLEFYGLLNHKKYSLSELLENHTQIALSISKDIPILKYFNEYLEIGYYPYSRKYMDKQNFFDSLYNAITKTIYEDISSVYNLKTENLQSFRKILYFVCISSPGEINSNRISQSIGKDNKTVETYISILEESGLFQFLYTQKNGHAFIRKPEKLYIDNTNIMFSILSKIAKNIDHGRLRETFVLNQLRNSNYAVFYPDKGDFIVENAIFEVGGKSKDRKQIAGNTQGFILQDGIESSSGNKIPLYLLGFLY